MGVININVCDVIYGYVSEWDRDYSDPTTFPGIGEVGDFQDKLKKTHPGWNDVLHQVSKQPGSTVKPL